MAGTGLGDKIGTSSGKSGSGILLQKLGREEGSIEDALRAVSASAMSILSSIYYWTQGPRNCGETLLLDPDCPGRGGVSAHRG